MQGRKFDDRNLTWRQLEGLDDLWFYVYNVDRKNGIVDVIFKFAANSRVPLHQHKTPYVTLVLQGELNSTGRTASQRKSGLSAAM